MILFPEVIAETAKHGHDTEFKLGVAIYSRGVINNLLASALPSNLPLGVISAPQVAMDDHRFDVIHDIISNESRYHLSSNLLNSFFKLRISTIVAHCLASDMSQTVISIKLGPWFPPGVVLLCSTAACRYWETKHGLVVSFRNRRGRCVHLRNFRCESSAWTTGGWRAQI